MDTKAENKERVRAFDARIGTTRDISSVQRTLCARTAIAHSMDLKRAASGLFDRCYEELASIALAINKHDSTALGSLAAVSHRHAALLDELVGERISSNDLRNRFLTWLHSHRWHREFLLESCFIAHALKKPRGYAGDADLMNMICKNDDRGKTPFAIALNRVYLDLPAATAVRGRAQSLVHHLELLPEGARVLNMACGPALEVREFLSRNPNRNVRFLLLDHDPSTINALRTSIRDDRCMVGLANAFRIMKGDSSVLIPRDSDRERDISDDFKGWRKILVPLRYERIHLDSIQKFDLVYSSGLYDYVRYTPDQPMRGTTGLTSQLFSFVKRGGQLLIGNFRTPGISGNPHAKHHMTMMDMYSDWRLLYRSNDEIMGFANGLPRQGIAFASSLLNEGLESISNGGVIGFLQLKRLH